MLLGKLVTLLGTAKGAAAASVMVAATVGTAVAATNPGVRNAVDSALQDLTQGADAKASNRLAVATARNDADERLRDAFQRAQQKLERLHSTPVDSTDRAKLTETINIAYAALRTRVNKAYNDLTVLTVGRSGLESRKPTGPDIKVVFTSDAQAKVDELVVAAIKDMNWIVGDAATAIARGLDVRWRDGEGRGQAE